ncbi:unnamed protein product [Didymodactylos carnosus]|uniref:Protein phosphatase n=1 Tax=Didymodactylos carnosus TaxID=1234261 RepID=A0A813VWQ9_9BILA|nr:unnamed protein product [Didymodactylos carnosus]CAF0849232.1 unnamed protein product [Didymodactylos carnosus]CAF3607273.1 unnamed protein product [Didymodactylos carnosus]CAF3636746.1 unnamed protein product [Didymodactylos carnosus]
MTNRPQTFLTRKNVVCFIIATLMYICVNVTEFLLYHLGGRKSGICELSMCYSYCGSSKHSCVATLNSDLLSGHYGDDVGFIQETNDAFVIGIADGVSGNRSCGLNPFLFSQALLRECQLLVEYEGQRMASNLKGLTYRALKRVESKSIYGSSTLCLLSLNKKAFKLDTMNLGDSGFVVIRESTIVYKSQPQYHKSRSPYQLCTTPPNFNMNEKRLYNDKPNLSVVGSFTLEPNDLILLATDGLFDNLYEDFILQIINKHLCLDDVNQDMLNHTCQLLVQNAKNAHIKPDDILVMLFSIRECPNVIINSSSTPPSPIPLSSSSSLESNESVTTFDEADDDVDDHVMDLFIFNE